MPKINLKNILSGKSDTAALLFSLIKELKASVYIEDTTQKILLGTGTETITFKEPVLD